jgi:hypothetical protein
MSHSVTLLATITSAQGRVVEALAGGSTVTAAAKAAGVARETVSRWVHHDPAFIAELHNTRAELAAQTRCALEALGTQAVATLAEALQDQRMRPTRLRAACAVLKMLGADKAETLLPTTPVEVQLRIREREQETRGRQASVYASEENARWAAYIPPEAEPASPESAAAETGSCDCGGSDNGCTRLANTCAPEPSASLPSGSEELDDGESESGGMDEELDQNMLLLTEEEELREIDRILSGSSEGSLRTRPSSSRKSLDRSTGPASSRITPRPDCSRAKQDSTRASQSCRKAW